MEKKMKILFSTQSVVEYDGKHYYSNPVLAAYHRYKMLGDEMSVICFEKKVDVAKSNQIDDGLIKFYFVKKINSIKALINNYQRSNNRIIKEQVRQADLCVINLPNFHGYQVVKYAKKYHKPYMTVVTGSIWDVYWNYGLKGKLIAPFAFFQMRKAQKTAPFSIYVTKEYLQSMYPSEGTTIGCSDADITTGIEEVLKQRIKRIKEIRNEGRCLRIGTVGAINIPYKGQKFVIKAISELKKKGITFEYHLLGQGDGSELLRYAKKVGVSDLLFIHGQIPHDEVMSFYDEIDIYCQPSMTEGLPRSVVEAMSRGCLCMGSNVGGIPELVNDEYLFQGCHTDEITNILSQITIEELERQAVIYFEKAKEFDIRALDQKRSNFLSAFKQSVV